MNHATLLISPSQLSLIQTHVGGPWKNVLKLSSSRWKVAVQRFEEIKGVAGLSSDSDYFEICFITGDTVDPEVSGRNVQKPDQRYVVRIKREKCQYEIASRSVILFLEIWVY